jgi:hypothetical protein
MGIFRLHTGSDNQSHIEELDLKAHPELEAPSAASTINFREWAPGHFIDWHPAPRRQYIISLSRTIEIGLDDGTTHRFGPDTPGWAKTPPARDTQPWCRVKNPPSAPSSPWRTDVAQHRPTLRVRQTIRKTDPRIKERQKVKTWDFLGCTPAATARPTSKSKT